MRRALLCAWVGCTPALQAVDDPPALRADAYPGTLRNPASYPVDFLWQQRVIAEYQDQSHSLHVAIQKRADELTVIGLTPFGSKAFVIEQHGLEVTYHSDVLDESPFPPRFVLLDIHRVWFPITPAPHSDGWHHREVDGEHVAELWQAQQLRRREFRRLSGEPAGLIQITYDDWSENNAVASRAVLNNHWFGYTLTISTLSAKRLSP